MHDCATELFWDAQARRFSMKEQEKLIDAIIKLFPNIRRLVLKNMIWSKILSTSIANAAPKLEELVFIDCTLVQGKKDSSVYGFFPDMSWAQTLRKMKIVHSFLKIFAYELENMNERVEYRQGLTVEDRFYEVALSLLNVLPKLQKLDIRFVRSTEHSPTISKELPPNVLWKHPTHNLESALGTQLTENQTLPKNFIDELNQEWIQVLVEEFHFSKSRLLYIVDKYYNSSESKKFYKVAQDMTAALYENYYFGIDTELGKLYFDH
jgi:hypothetical protein